MTVETGGDKVKEKKKRCILCKKLHSPDTLTETPIILDYMKYKNPTLVDNWKQELLIITGLVCQKCRKEFIEVPVYVPHEGIKWCIDIRTSPLLTKFYLSGKYKYPIDTFF